MEQRRLILFLGLSVGFLVAWNALISPVLFPKPVRKPGVAAEEKPVDENPADDNKAESALNENKEADSDEPEKESKDKAADKPEIAEKEKAKEKGKEKAEEKEKAEPEKPIVKALPRHPDKMVALGSVDPDSGYYLFVEITSEGAAVESIQLNDPRYSILKNRTIPLKVVGNNSADLENTKTFNLKLSSSEADSPALQYFKSSLGTENWEVAETRKDADGLISGVTFRFASEELGIELFKSYDIKKPEPKPEESHDGRDTQYEGYELHFKITVKNLSADKNQVLAYILQGPVGIPLENADNARKFRDIKMGFLSPDEKDFPVEERSIVSNSMTASGVVSNDDENTIEDWTSPIKYIGVDNQYFAALLVPVEDQLEKQYIESAVATVVEKVAKPTTHSDISVVLTSKAIKLKPKEEFSHEYALFAGPKRQDLLSPIGVDQALDFGWFGFVSKTILMIMSFLHNSIYIPYGIAIICVTVLVRGMMYPISRKQAMGAKKMKELQPKIAELKKKHANEKEKMAQAQMQLFRDNNYNPFAGCLPVFLQLPVFIGLYSALNNSVDLRMAKFLWVDNLAAPDHLFKMPFSLPFLGDYFNLLPLITVGLFLLQQRMFMPPATDPEQAMQQKMMNYMMLFMGFMFYRVPAGLCVYFIASSLWGITERKMLDINKKAPATGDADGSATDPASGDSGGSGKKFNPKNKPAEEKPKGFFAKIMEQAETAATQANKQATLDKSASNKGKKNKGNKKKR